jgi:protein-tyrosine phosphatase
MQQSKENGHVLVHCAAGMSRSPTVVIAYLMKVHRKSLREAFAYVRSKRFVSPNYGFMKQLSAYAKELGLDDTVPSQFIQFEEQEVGEEHMIQC